MRFMLHGSAYLLCVVSVFGQQTSFTGDTPFEAIPPAATVSDKLAFSIDVPSFDALDLSGIRRRSANLQGKLTVVHIWSIFCTPCRQQQPALQDFFNKVSFTKNIQVLTINVDSDPTRVQAYMRDNGYTFPVIQGLDFRRSELQPPSFPVNETWVIGPNGRRSDTFKTWSFGRMLIEVEKMTVRSDSRDGQPS